MQLLSREILLIQIISDVELTR